jgi:hypothetical protein
VGWGGGREGRQAGRQAGRQEEREEDLISRFFDKLSHFSCYGKLQLSVRTRDFDKGGTKDERNDGLYQLYI